MVQGGGGVGHDSVVVVRVVAAQMVSEDRGGGGAAHDAGDGWADRHRRAHGVVQMVDAVEVAVGRRSGHPRHQILQTQRRIRQRLHALHGLVVKRRDFHTGSLPTLTDKYVAELHFYALYYMNSLRTNNDGDGEKREK